MKKLLLSLLMVNCLQAMELTSPGSGQNPFDSSEEWQPYRTFLSDLEHGHNHLAGYAILRNPALIRYKDRMGRTALSCAVECDNVGVCKELLRNGASPQGLRSDIPEIQELLDLYSQPSFIERHITIPARESHADTICRIFELTFVVTGDQTPLSDRSILAKNPTWKLMKKHCSQETKDQILMIAFDRELIDSLRKRDWGQSDPHLQGENTLMQANLMVLAICIGANPNLESNPYESALNHAIELSLKNMFFYLLDKGARRVQQNVLTWCTDIEIAQELIQRKIPIPKNILFCLADVLNKQQIYDLILLYLDNAAPLLSTTRQMVRTTIFHKLILFPKPNSRQITQLIIGHFVAEHKAFLQLLYHLKRTHPGLTGANGCLRQHFPRFALPLNRLREALLVGYTSNQTTFQISNWQELNPEHCTYDGLRKQLKAAVFRGK